jgi:transketolase
MLNPDLFLNDNVFDREAPMAPTRNGYGEGLMALGETHPNVLALSADLTESTRTDAFAKAYPERFLQVGVAEQNMAAVAAGLAVSGKIPYIASYATFSPGKNWETLRTTAVYNKAPVKIAGHHAGIMTGPDGSTHQATEDIAITRVWPDITIFVPCDSVQAKKATIAAADIDGPVYLRFSRDKTPIMTTDKTPFTPGKAELFWVSEEPEVTIFAMGYMTHYALLAAKGLETMGIDTLVVNVPTIKPIDQKQLVELAARSGAVVTVEDHQVAGGLGGMIAEVLAKHHPLPIEFIGLQDTFAETGSPVELIEKYGMDAPSIQQAAKRVIKRKKE